MTDRTVTVLADIIASNNSLQLVDISGNDISGFGAKALAKVCVLERRPLCSQSTCPCGTIEHGFVIVYECTTMVCVCVAPLMFSS